MPKFLFKDFSGGIVTDNDAVDMPNDTVSILLNWVLRLGKLIRRKACVNLITSGLTAVVAFAEAIVNRTDGTANRFILVQDGTGTTAIERYDYSAGSYAAASIGTQDDDTTPVVTKFQNVNGVMRLGTGGTGINTTKRAMWYGHIARNFFNDAETGASGTTESGNSWYYLINADLTPRAHGTLITATAAGSGDLNGTFFYRTTFEYDGYQESFHIGATNYNGVYENVSAGADDYIQLLISIRFSEFNKRITAINLYMAAEPTTTLKLPTTAFYLIGRVDINDSNWAIDYTTDSGENTVGNVHASDDPDTFEVQNATTFNVGDRIKIESEENMLITAIVDNDITCSRGGSKAAHTAPQDIYLGYYQISPRMYVENAESRYDFPAGFYTTTAAPRFDGELQSFVEEFYTKLNAISGITAGFDINNYMNGVYINQRQFVIRPSIDINRIEYRWVGDVYPRVYNLPYDAKQVVLFSRLNQPDSFDFMLDYIDVSTPQGDACTGVAELWGNLIVLKELNMFKVRFNNSGNSLNWQIDEQFQEVGMIAPNSLAVGNGKLFFAGKDHIYMFDGNKAIPITKDRIQDDYLAKLAESFGEDGDYDNIFGLYDPNQNVYRLNFLSDGSETQCFVYDERRDYWLKNQYDDGTNAMVIKSLVLGVDYDILANIATKIIKVDSSTSASVEDVSCRYESQWESLNGNPFQEKRINQIKSISINDTSFTFRLYKDYAAGTSYSETVTANATRDVTPKETSLTGKVFKLGIVTAANLEGNEDLQVFEFEIDYEVLDEQ